LTLFVEAEMASHLHHHHLATAMHHALAFA
jgi:hypothetical protein